MTGRYRRLPGQGRGLVHRASVWLGDDHLLLVKSAVFREEYKRYYLRDVQAIAVADAPRFHISSRAVAIGALWLLAMAAVIPNYLRAAPYLWVIAATLVAAWIFVSATCSCRCRIYTAVSSDELPSLYRTWTARRFLAAVEPKIAEAQGVIEGEWAEAAESRDIGPPPEGRIAGQPAAATSPAATAPRVPSHTLTSDALVAVLFASALAAFLTLTAPEAVVRPVAISFLVLKVGLAVGVFVQHYKGKLESGMQKVAIATLLVTGATYYVEQMSGAIAEGIANARKQNPQIQVMPVMVTGNRFAAEVNGGASLLLGCAGLAVILLAKDRKTA
jgi:hypothetical protein